MRGRKAIGGHKRAAFLIVLLASGCVAPRAAEPPPSRAPRPPARPVPRPPVRPVQPAPPGYSLAGLEGVIGRDARAMEAAFGRPDLDIREGGARKLQFVRPACVLDLYLYPPGAGAEPVVRYVDARAADGRDVDRAGCVAALTPRPSGEGPDP